MPQTNWFEKGATSVLAATVIYWAQVPHAVIVMLIMLGLNVFMTAAQKWIIEDAFKPKLIMKSLLIGFTSIPLLVALHFSEEPLHLDFDLDTWAAWVISLYAAISIMERYILLGGVGGAGLQSFLDRLKSTMQAKAGAGSSLIVTDRVAQTADGATHTLSIEKPQSPIIKP